MTTRRSPSDQKRNRKLIRMMSSVQKKSGTKSFSATKRDNEPNLAHSLRNKKLLSQNVPNSFVIKPTMAAAALPYRISKTVNIFPLDEWRQFHKLWWTDASRPYENDRRSGRVTHWNDRKAIAENTMTPPTCLARRGVNTVTYSKVSYLRSSTYVTSINKKRVLYVFHLRK